MLSQIPYGSAAAGVVVNLPPMPDIASGGGAAGVVYPSGTVEIAGGEVMPNQNYDVQVELLVPLSPLNRDLGNFMVEVDFYSAKTGQELLLLHRTHRPAILTYRSPLPTLLNTILKAPLLLTRFTTESELITIPILERTSFPTRALTPKSMKVTLKAQRIQTYKVRVRFRARLGGLRNFMYSYRLIAAGVFVSVFWFIEVVCAGMVWWVLFSAGGGGVGGGGGGGGVVQVVQVRREESGEGEEGEEDEEETPVEAGRVPRSSTPGARPRTPRGGREREGGYLPSPSPTPQPQPLQPQPQEILLPEPVREGYADNEESETDGSTVDGMEGPAWDSARRMAMVEDDDEMGTEPEGSEEEAVLVSGSRRAPPQGDSGVGSSLYGSTSATMGRRGSSGSGGGGLRRR